MYSFLQRTKLTQRTPIYLAIDFIKEGLGNMMCQYASWYNIPSVQESDLWNEGPKWCNSMQVILMFYWGNSAVIDLPLLANCDHVIMTFGIFGWWGAWLSAGEVVYYKNFLLKWSFSANKYDSFLPDWIGMLLLLIDKLKETTYTIVFLLIYFFPISYPNTNLS